MVVSFRFVENITTNACNGIMKSVKEAVDKEAEEKGVSTHYVVRPPSNNVKVGVHECGYSRC